MSAKMSVGFADFATNVNNLFNMRQTGEGRRELQGADMEAPDGAEIKAAAFRGRRAGAPPGTRHASAHHRGAGASLSFLPEPEPRAALAGDGKSNEARGDSPRPIYPEKCI